MKRLPRTLALPVILGMSSCDGPRPVDMPVVAIDPQSLTVLSPAQDALWDVRDVLVADDTIWALTASAPHVHGFGPTGKLTARFGRVGQGPGEFRFPSAMWPGGVGGSLTVWDSGSFTALTFSTGGAWLSSSRTPVRGAIRSDIGTVTFGDPLRAVPVTGGLVVARYDSGVNHGRDLWNGRLVHIPDDGGDPRVLLDFATDLPGAARLPAASLMAPVPLWDGCPDGRIAVLDPVARKLFMVDPARNEFGAFALPWHPEPLGTDARIAYMRSRARAETARGSVSEAEITRLATEAAASLAELFAKEEPLGVDLKCAPDRVWIRSFEGSDPLGNGPLWRTVSLHRALPAFSRVVFPAGFIPHRITESLAFGVVADAGGLQRLATVLVPPFARQRSHHHHLPSRPQARRGPRIQEISSREKQAHLDTNRVSRQSRTPAARHRSVGGEGAGSS